MPVLAGIFLVLAVAADEAKLLRQQLRSDRYRDDDEHEFMWGTATAAYQIEGAYQEDGRLPSIWDTYSHIPGKIRNNENGDVADDSYHRYMQDIELMKAQGLKYYRLSISWPRILPDGKSVNMAGIQHYQKVIKALKDAGITPLVTIYHWDIPEALSTGPSMNGAWLNPDVVEFYVTYADTLFKYLGDDVKWWLTFNEVYTFCWQGYGVGNHAPGRCSDRSKCDEGNTSTEPYMCTHNVLRSHAAAYRLYNEKYRTAQNGKVSITLNCDWAEPLDSNSQADKDAAQRNLLWQLGWFADPVHFGKYPDEMIEAVGDRLPKFTPEESEALKGSSDYFGLNSYTSKYVHATGVNPSEEPSWATDQTNIASPYDAEGNLIGAPTESAWNFKVPWGLRKLVNWVSERYGNENMIVVTENGCAVQGESDLPIQEAVHDEFRADWYTQYTKQLLLAKTEDGVNVGGYFAWSLMDNFEWADGYTPRFGMHYVDFKDGNYTRYVKDSMVTFSKIASDYYAKQGDRKITA